MGSELRRDLREALGPEIKGLPRSVALEIADDARYDDDWRYDPDKGRRSKATLEELRRWTASKDTNVVRDALKRLSAAGWEFRIPIGRGKDGRILFAVPGRAVEFRVPDFDLKGESPLPLTGKGESPLPLGRVTTPSEGVTTPSRASQDYPPISSVTDPPTSLFSVAEASGSAEAVEATPSTGKPAERKKKAKSTAPRKPNEHQAADGLTDEFWKRYGKGRAQPFIAVRTVIRTAISNGVERDELSHCLDAIGKAGNTVSGGTIQFELGQRQKKTQTGYSGTYRNPEQSAYYEDLK
ncbi:hypothetical protein [Streptomyces sp. NPDC091212]|uniref:hypothetical protein n=1 Tax=Streptomyces sp. NPDC091212 TaxID=3155191 RepID=UPI0034450C7E